MCPIICDDFVPEDHPLWQKASYLSRRGEIESCIQQWMQIPTPDEHRACIVVVCVSQLWTLQRPQLVLGIPRAPLLAQQKMQQGRCVLRARDFIAVEAPTAYNDPNLQVMVRSIGRAPHYQEPARRDIIEQHDPFRLHQAKRKPKRRGRRIKREGVSGSEPLGLTFTTSGEQLPVSSTLPDAGGNGTPLSTFMVVRVVIPPGYPLALARSYYSLLRLTGAPQSAQETYEVLYLPGSPGFSPSPLLLQP